ncbi:integrator complex subunit 11-like isoform X2 [Zophobas morio]|uniref:integrator complex subunit 11-like isoform X2 n=1 Tax=Zophobas morio TaxID=2755281 RepID=UPI0030830056
MQIKVVPLGAGQDVGRSCVLVTLNGKNIMFDCGMHMGYSDDRRFPDFNYISKTKSKINQHLDAVIITHFHLDHCGALPFFTEMIGYEGPIYMTQPTKAIAPILLEDYRRIMTSRKGVENFFTSEMIKQSMKKVRTIRLHETVHVDDDLEIKAYYAGHVLGAAMFFARVGDASCVYTGDYNMTPDRHLGAAWIDKCRPDVLISESTYATTIRDSKRCRERDFLKKVYDCISQGGKVLIPVFALGRAQELCILLETFWERMNLKVPIYFAAGLTEKATNYYKMFINWTNEKIKKTFLERNMFDFKHITSFDRSNIMAPGAQVLFATPGMLHAGLSLEVFCKWAPDSNNMVIMPGYCVAGTVGHKVLSGQKRIECDGRLIDVRLSVEHLSFSAHADAKGIMQLIRLAEPRNVMLVHGEAEKMKFLQQKITHELKIPCTFPENGRTVAVEGVHAIPVQLSTLLLEAATQKMMKDREMALRLKRGRTDQAPYIEWDNSQLPQLTADKWTTSFNGVLVANENDTTMKVLDICSAVDELGLPRHELNFTLKIPNYLTCSKSSEEPSVLHSLYNLLKRKLPKCLSDDLCFENDCLCLSSITITADSAQFTLDWNYQDEKKFEVILDLMRRL